MFTGASITIGLAASLIAAGLIGVGLVLQALDARRVDRRHGLRLTLLGRLLRRPRWVIGTVVGYLAFPFQLLALRHAPLILVQPVHACGLLLVLGAGAWMLRECVRLVDLAGVGAIIAGLALLAWGAPPGSDPEISQPIFAAATGALVLISFLPYALGPRCGRLTLMLCSGVGFAAANMAVKGLTDQLAMHAYLASAGYLAAAAIGSTAGVLSQMTAFQRYPAVEVVPITFAVPNFMPVILGVLVLHESWARAALAGAPFALGGFLLLLGTAALARATPVARVMRTAAG